MGSHEWRPNIVWITLDSVRQDRTTMGGHRRDTTPNLARIASLPSGEAFRHCIATDKWSLSSTASTFTGTYSEYHQTGYRTQTLPGDIVTVPELLRAEGWTTAGLSVNRFFSDSTGLDRGFDWFKTLDASNFARIAGPWTFLKFVANLRRHSAGFTLDKRKHRPDYLLNELAKRRLESLARHEEPFFLAAHYHGAHHPYYPPIPYQDRFADGLDRSPTEACTLAFEHTTDIYAEIARTETYDRGDWNAIKTMYDSLLAYSDDLVGDLFEFVQSLELGNTVFVVTADHGDLLGEYGLLGHQLVLHDGLIRVPLVVYSFDELVGRGDDLVQPLDVMQTLLASVGCDTSQCQGVDLRKETREFAFSQRGAGGGKALDEIQSHNPEFDRTLFHESKLTAARSKEFKYQRSESKSELFALPDETDDVSQYHPERTAEMDAQLTKWLTEVRSRFDIDSETADFSDDVKRQLSDLGYRID